MQLKRSIKLVCPLPLNYDELKTEFGDERRLEIEDENQAVNAAENVLHKTENQAESQSELPFENGLNRVRAEAEAAPTPDDNQSKSASSEPDKSPEIEALRAANTCAREVINRARQMSSERDKPAAVRNHEAAKAVFKRTKKNASAEIASAVDKLESGNIMPKPVAADGESQPKLDNVLVRY